MLNTKSSFLEIIQCITNGVDFYDFMSAIFLDILGMMFEQLSVLRRHCNILSFVVRMRMEKCGDSIRKKREREREKAISSPQTNYSTAEYAFASHHSKKIIFHQFEHNQFEMHIQMVGW